MEQISSPNSFFPRVVMPIFFAVFYVVLAVVTFSKAFSSGQTLFVKVSTTVVILGSGVLVYLMLRYFVLKTVEAVYVDNDSFIVRHGKQQEVIPFVQITNISYVNVSSPPKAVLYLNAPSKFGRKIEFIITRQGILSDENDAMDRVIEAVDAAKRRAFAKDVH